MLLALACNGSGTTDSPPIETGGPEPAELADVFINEFMASNTLTLTDELGAYPDWIELYNASEEEAAIGGWWLTDDVADPFKWQIPDAVRIPPGGFVVVFADNDPEEGDLHASFQLDAEFGEDIALFGPNVLDNPLIDSVEAFGTQQSDISTARQPDGGDSWVADDTPTPGASNG